MIKIMARLNLSYKSSLDWFKLNDWFASWTNANTLHFSKGKPRTLSGSWCKLNPYKLSKPTFQYESAQVQPYIYV